MANVISLDAPIGWLCFSVWEMGEHSSKCYFRYSFIDHFIYIDLYKRYGDYFWIHDFAILFYKFIDSSFYYHCV